MKRINYKSKTTTTFLSYSFLFVLLLYLIFFGIIKGWDNINSDFPNYYTSSRLILDFKDVSQIYNDEWFQNKIHLYGMNEAGKFSPFPPATAFVMIVPAMLKPITAKRIYIIINIIVLFLTAFLFYRIASISFINALIIILLSGAGIVNNFLLGQFYLLLLFLITAGYYFQSNTKYYLCGSIWGAAASIKYFPVVFLFVFAKRKYLKLITGFVSLTIGINIFCMLIMGTEVYYNFLSSVFLSHLNGELSNQSPFAHQFQSWNSLLRNLFVFDLVENPHPLINWENGFTISRIFVYTIVIGTTTSVFYKIRNHRLSIPLNISLVTVTLLVLSPASATYHYLLLSFPTILLLSECNKKKNHAAGLLFVIIHSLIGFLPAIILKLFPGSGSNILLSFPRLWLISFYYFWLIILLRGNFIKEEPKPG